MTSSLSEGIGARVKALRAKRCPHESGRKFAERAGVNFAYLNKLENGKNNNPQLDTLERIAAALGVTVVDLLSEADTVPAA